MTPGSLWDIIDFNVTSTSSDNDVTSTISISVASPSNVLQLFTNVSSLITWDSSADCHVESYYYHVGVGILVSAVAAIAVVGNFLVLCTFSRHSSLRTSSNFLVINLTIADLIMSLLDFPMVAVSSFNGCWLLGYTGCQIYGSTTSIFSLVTINTLAAISFDRYFVVVHRRSTMHRMAKSTTGFIISAIWFLSIGWSVLPFACVGPYRLEGMGTSCTFNYVEQGNPQRWFFLGLVAFNFFLPLLLIIYSYCGILSYVKRVKRELKLLQTGYRSTTIRQRVDKKAEIKTAIIAIIIIGIFCLAWTPYVIIAFIGLFGTPGRVTPLISLFPNILAKVSTVSNPILYTLGHQDLRRKLRALFFATQNKLSMRPTFATAELSFRENYLQDIPMH